MIILLQNEARVKKNAAGITKRGKGYNKTRQVLQNAAIITKRGSTILTLPEDFILMKWKFVSEFTLYYCGNS